jgi:hypothetical protein
MTHHNNGGSMAALRPRRVLLLFTVVALAVAGLLVSTSATPAQATPAQCTPPTNGFIRVTNGDNAHVVRYFTVGGTATSLQWKYVNGRQYVYAYLGGSTVLSGDLVWMDWSRDGGLTWIQCGPFPITQNGVGRRTYAQRTSTDPRWVMRACSRIYLDVSRCTTWW